MLCGRMERVGGRLGLDYVAYGLHQRKHGAGCEKELGRKNLPPRAIRNRAAACG
jgi:hypothetical protein